jgi:hypothetical protein
MSLSGARPWLGEQNALQCFIGSLTVCLGGLLYCLGKIDIVTLGKINLAVPLAYITSVLISYAYGAERSETFDRPVLRAYWHTNKILFPVLSPVAMIGTMTDTRLSAWLAGLCTIAITLGMAPCTWMAVASAKILRGSRRR